MTWFAFRNAEITGQSFADIDAAGAEEKLLVATGFHGYATQAEADANRNTVSPLQTATLDSLEGAHAASSAASAAAGAVTSVPAFLHDLTTRNLWLRVLKILGGLALIVTGIIQLTRAQNIVKTAAKGAMTG